MERLEHHQENILRAAQQILQKYEHEIPNLQIMCKDQQEVNTHLELLATFSPVFRNIFGSLPNFGSHVLLAPDFRSDTIEKVIKILKTAWSRVIKFDKDVSAFLQFFHINLGQFSIGAKQITSEENVTEQKKFGMNISESKNLEIFECDACSKTFSSRSDLSYHIRSHTVKKLEVFISKNEQNACKKYQIQTLRERYKIPGAIKLKQENGSASEFGNLEIEKDSNIQNYSNKPLLRCPFDCYKKWDEKQRRDVIHYHLMSHFRDDVNRYTMMYIKGKFCTLCDKEIKTGMQRERHLFHKHKVLKTEIEDCMQKIFKNTREESSVPNKTENDIINNQLLEEIGDIKKILLEEALNAEVDNNWKIKNHETSVEDIQNQLLLDQDISDSDESDDDGGGDIDGDDDNYSYDDGGNYSDDEDDEADLIQQKLLVDADISDDEEED